MRARHRLPELLLRHGIVYCGGAAWTGEHDLWLRHDAFGQLPMQPTRSAFDACYDAVLAVTARRDRPGTQIEQIAAASEFTPMVRRLGCLRSRAVR
jgi:transposase